MKKTSKEPVKPPPEDSLKKLADFTKQILRVPKNDLKDKDASSGRLTSDRTARPKYR
jgi:hypothetical protein